MFIVQTSCSPHLAYSESLVRRLALSRKFHGVMPSAKLYSYVMTGEEHKKCKGIKKAVVKNINMKAKRNAYILML